MKAMEGSSSSADDGQAEAAWQRAVRAADRAARETATAERHDRRFLETGRVFHSAMAARHHAVAERHLTTARLQESYARRVREWANGHGPGRREATSVDRPLFMAGVAEACGTPSAALTLMGDDLSQLAVAASDRPSRGAQDLEYVLTAGPGREAARAGSAVYVSGAAIEELWPGYGSGLAALGLSSVAALPLTVPPRCIGALTVFDPPSALAGSGALDEVAAALTAGVLLGPDADPGLYGGADIRAAVHQAAGALSEQTGGSIGDSLALIKARAFALGESPEWVAQSFLSGKLKLH
ncbi:GAF domain-containing protein [Streptomyces sp. NBC_01381]|uniref:GAF domain-containing protein n=1 Tax=Streptomyces sp. NBC_01381 TaxID=2903845 RepID=UPI002252DDF5|nr:GAF domain-containing protein [Streptomyces sp. NBC_01381]MCX4670859.1 GAF domain-containing protein [Streptomyces sp. NBC_01381]